MRHRLRTVEINGILQLTTISCHPSNITSFLRHRWTTLEPESGTIRISRLPICIFSRNPARAQAVRQQSLTAPSSSRFWHWPPRPFVASYGKPLAKVPMVVDWWCLRAFHHSRAPIWTVFMNKLSGSSFTRLIYGLYVSGGWILFCLLGGSKKLTTLAYAKSSSGTAVRGDRGNYWWHCTLDLKGGQWSDALKPAR